MELHAHVQQDEDGSYWAEVKELPGCFASGFTLDELMEALTEAIAMCLSTDTVTKTKAKNGASGSARLDELKLITV
jgi:predicted RNase H-like HicB family nuclease